MPMLAIKGERNLSAGSWSYFKLYLTLRSLTPHSNTGNTIYTATHMRIGFDGKRAVSNMTGLGNYSRLVIESMARQYPADEMVVYSPAPRDNPRTSSWAAIPNISYRYPGAGEARLGKSVWRTWGISKSLKADEIDIYHGLSNELPLNIAKTRLPSVVTIHDVIYRTMPECYKAIDRRLYDFKYGHAARNATKIIAISQCTKRDVMRFYNVPEEKIEVIYQGCDPSFSRILPAEGIEEARRQLSLPRRYIVQVGTIERRKNALLSVRALAAAGNRVSAVTLLLLGRATPYLAEVMAEARRLGVAERVKVVSDIPFNLLPAVVQGAEAALYPSRYEGFGLPVLEALSCGTPTLAATGSCLEEAGGEAALYVSPDDTRGAAQAIVQMLTSRELRSRMCEKGREHASHFSNENVAARLHDIYAALLQKS